MTTGTPRRRPARFQSPGTGGALAQPQSRPEGCVSSVREPPWPPGRTGAWGTSPWQWPGQDRFGRTFYPQKAGHQQKHKEKGCCVTRGMTARSAHATERQRKTKKQQRRKRKKPKQRTESRKAEMDAAPRAMRMENVSVQRARCSWWVKIRSVSNKHQK